MITNQNDAIRLAETALAKDPRYTCWIKQGFHYAFTAQKEGEFDLARRRASLYPGAKTTGGLALQDIYAHSDQYNLWRVQAGIPYGPTDTGFTCIVDLKTGTVLEIIASAA